MVNIGEERGSWNLMMTSLVAQIGLAPGNDPFMSAVSKLGDEDLDYDSKIRDISFC